MNESLHAHPQNKNENEESETSPVNQERRDFLKRLGAVGVGVTAASVLGKPLLQSEGRKFYGETIEKETLEHELTALREKLRQERGVEIDFSPSFPQEVSDGLTSEPVEYLIEKRDICEALMQAFALYPHFVHTQTNLSIIRIENNLKLHEHEEGEEKERDIAGLASRDDGVMHVEYNELRPHIPNDDAWVRDKIEKFFPNSPEEKQEWTRSIFHHELAHFIEGDDSVNDEQYSRETRGFWYNETLPENYVQTLYVGELKFLVKRNTITEEQMTQLKQKYAGFARSYGKANFREDRATIAEALMTRGGSLGELQERAQTDEVLRKKITFMKKLYLKKSCGLIGETYWNLMERPSADEKMIAEHLKNRASILSHMSDKAFVLYMRDKAEEKISDDILLEWKKTLREWVENEGKKRE